MSRRFTGLGAAAALLIIVFTVVLSLGLVACGDPYVGTWKANVSGQDQKLKIEKSGDKYVIYDPATPDQKTDATEKDGKLVVVDPTGGTDVMTIERKDDKLIMSLQGVSIELTKE